MSGSAWIRKRVVQSGDRWDVKYRQGCAAFNEVHAGTFRTKKDAVTRQAMIRGWIAQGKDVEEELRSLGPAVERPRSCAVLWPVWVKSLRDVGAGRRRTLANAWEHIRPVIGSVPPGRVTVEDGMRLVLALEEAELKASTVGLYFKTARQFLDAHTDKNPLKSRLIRLPKVETEDVQAMSFQEWMLLREAMRDDGGGRLKIGPALAFAMDFIEAGGFRIGDAKQLLVGDIDFFEGKVRVSRARGKSSQSRWVPMPRVLLQEIAERQLRPDAAALPELQQHSLYNAMDNACRRAGLLHYHPHDLRHRRASLWIAQGLPLTDLGVRIGHADLTTTLRVYAHVVSSAEDLWTADDYVGGVR